MSDSEKPVRKRPKISLACVPCRERKIRCTGERPACASCVRRSNVSTKDCTYTAQSTSEPTNTETIQCLFERVRFLEESQSSNAESNREIGVHLGSQAQRRGYGHLHGKTSTSNRQSREGIELSRHLDFYQGHDQNTGTGKECSISSELSSSSLREPPTAQSEDQATAQLSLANSTSCRPQQLMPFNDQAHFENLGANTCMIKEEKKSSEDAMGAALVCDGQSFEDNYQYYGSSSAIAFMKAISKVLKHENDKPRYNAGSATGPARRRQNLQSDFSSLLPKMEGATYRPDVFALPSRSLTDHLLENYWTRVHPLCPFIHRSTFDKAYAVLWNPRTDEDHLSQDSADGLGNAIDAGPAAQTFYCALNTMLALGCQFSDIPLLRRKELAAMFEQRSRKLLVVDILDRGSIAIVQTMLLAGQYLQSTCSPQRCWNSIGIACRIAQGLGLHVEEHPRLKGKLGLEMRRRVWHACIVLDMSASMTMGRPFMLSHNYSTMLPSPLCDEQQAQSLNRTGPENLPLVRFFLESIKHFKILGAILATIYDQSTSGADTNPMTNKERGGALKGLEAVLELDKKLIAFKNELPGELQCDLEVEMMQRPPGCFASTLQMQANVLHARYLQSRILLYRTAFIEMCQKYVSRMNSEAPNCSQKSEGIDLDDVLTSHIAVSCVESARDLIKLVHQTWQSGTADFWWYSVYYAYTAGMVIMLAQLCGPLKQSVGNSSLNESWILCRVTLSTMSSEGPVAQRCLESLDVIQEIISCWGKSKHQESPAGHLRKVLLTSGSLDISKSSTDASRRGGLSNDQILRFNHQTCCTVNVAEQRGLQSPQADPQPDSVKQTTGSKWGTDNAVVMERPSYATIFEENVGSFWTTDLEDLWNYPVEFGLEADLIS